ncbi:hypothetical protein D9M69_456440 [compost metagenome]
MRDGNWSVRHVELTGLQAWQHSCPRQVLVFRFHTQFAGDEIRQIAAEAFVVTIHQHVEGWIKHFGGEVDTAARLDVGQLVGMHG